eukprot:CAMPEP_0182819000 /NCGR_PEP_ID=MMETSP0006_2-20121128/12340_1 /TAXON_ID=97485 /ORGANISM="Prymnesium parvum, Strain Texoma1" /LENGTH=243 /DNA_ID=CAMNT_0024945535 /DNA_START=230 /DNA_END=965 /DNA_ORIENTATION=-
MPAKFGSLGKTDTIIQNPLDVDHAFFSHVKRFLETVDLLLVSLHDHIGAHLVVFGHNLHSHPVRSLGVIQVVLPRERREQSRRVPDVPQPIAFAECRLLEDGEHEGERAKADERAEGEEGGAPRLPRLRALEDDYVACVGDAVVVRLEEGDDVACGLTHRSAAVCRGPRHLIRAAHDLRLDGARHEGVQAGEGQDVEHERKVEGYLRIPSAVICTSSKRKRGKEWSDGGGGVCGWMRRRRNIA